MREIERVANNNVYRASTTSGTHAADTCLSSNESWGIWVSASASTTSVTLDLEGTWGTWNTGTTASAAGNSMLTWQDWAANPFESQIMGEPAPATQRYAVPPVIDQEERARRIAARQQRFQEEHDRLAAARVQATELLESILNEVQRQSIKEEDWFLVIGKSGNIYRLRRGRVGNIDLVSPKGEVLKSFCVHPGVHVPNADDLVAQKLHLESDDKHLIANANVHNSYPTGEIIDLTKRLPKAA